MWHAENDKDNSPIMHSLVARMVEHGMQQPDDGQI